MHFHCSRISCPSNSPAFVVLAKGSGMTKRTTFHATATIFCLPRPNLLMPRSTTRHLERHRTTRIGWLRAAVLGANDGLISTASLVMGVAATGSTRSAVLIAGIAGLVAGSMSMAAGEYVSVSSQADTEAADLARERRELASSPDAEKAELVAIYVRRGLTAKLATQVAEQLMAKDALEAHARDELGFSDFSTARPLQAAVTSARTVAPGALLPVLVSAAVPRSSFTWAVSASTIALLAVLGGIAARVGAAPIVRGALRVMLWRSEERRVGKECRSRWS